MMEVMMMIVISSHVLNRQSLSRTWTSWKILSNEKEKCAVGKMESLFQYYNYRSLIFTLDTFIKI